MTDSPVVSPSTTAWTRHILRENAVLVAFVVLTLLAWLRYDGFLGNHNVTEFLRYNARFGFIALGMTFVIITGGIDLSVGSVVALASVLAALCSPYGLLPALVIPVLAGGLVGALNGTMVAVAGVPSFIATLVSMMAVRGLALIVTSEQSVPVDMGCAVITIGEANIAGWMPVPMALLLLAYAGGWVVFNYAPIGRQVVAVGDHEAAARLMGVPVSRVKLFVYVLSGVLAGWAGVLLAASSFSGLPTEGVSWELQVIAAVVVGGTLLTGGSGSVGGTFVGVLLLGLIFKILDFENGLGGFDLKAHWQSVIRGIFLLLVVVFQSRRVPGRTGRQ